MQFYIGEALDRLVTASEGASTRGMKGIMGINLKGLLLTVRGVFETRLMFSGFSHGLRVTKSPVLELM